MNKFFISVMIKSELLCSDFFKRNGFTYFAKFVQVTKNFLVSGNHRLFND